MNWRSRRSLVIACAVFVSSALGGCRREQAGAADGGGAPNASTLLPRSAPSSVSAPHEHRAADVFTRPAPAAGEAERRVVASGDEDPLLRPYATRLRTHFKDPKPPLTVQRASLLGGGSAILVRQEAEQFPLLLVEDRERKLLWHREKPTVAMLPPVRDPVVVGRSSGGVALFAYDVPARVVAGRLLDPDGTPFTDLSVMHVDDCQWMSAAQWPKRGIVVVCARATDNRMQIIRTDNTLALANEGVVVGRASRPPAPISIGFDTDDTIMLASYSKGHVLVFRYDATGSPKWPEPFDMDARAPEKSAERIQITPRGGGISLKGIVDIDSNGAVLR